MIRQMLSNPHSRIRIIFFTIIFTFTIILTLVFFVRRDLIFSVTDLWTSILNILGGILFTTVLINFFYALGILLSGETQTTQPQQPITASNIASTHDYEIVEDKTDALLTAWRRFIDYDHASQQLKRDRNQIRTVIIILGVITSFLAVVLSFINVPPNSGELIYRMGDFAKGFFQIILAILPITVAGLIAYATEFAPSTSWAVYRVGAELIRREIYLYRLNAGPYQTESQDDRKRIFLDNIKKASQLQRVHNADNLENPVLIDAAQQVLKGNGRFPHSHKIDDDEVFKIVKGVKQLSLENTFMNRLFEIYNALEFWNISPKQPSEEDNDNGFESLKPDQYVQLRLIPQLNWYVSRIQKDYTALRTWKQRILFWGSLGSVIVAVAVVAEENFEPFVAVTTAITLAMGLYLELRMFNHTYLIYSTVKQQLHNLYDEWHMILQHLDKNNPDTLAIHKNFIFRVEQTLQSEREQWMLRVIQTQTALEQQLAKSEETVDGTRTTAITDTGLAASFVTLADTAFRQLKEYNRAKLLYIEAYRIFEKYENRAELFNILQQLVLLTTEQALAGNNESSLEAAVKLYGWFHQEYDKELRRDTVEKTIFDRQIDNLRTRFESTKFDALRIEGESMILANLIPEIAK